MFDIKDPISISVSTLVICFIIISGLLYLFRPRYVTIADSKAGKRYVLSWKLTLVYSITFSLVCSIAAFLLATRHKINEPITAYTAPDELPSSAVASAYCGSVHKVNNIPIIHN